MVLLLGILFSLSACGTARAASDGQAGPGPQEAAAAETVVAETLAAETTPAETVPAETFPVETAPAETLPAETTFAETAEEVQKTMLQMKIGETKVKVNWEDNASVAALKELCKDAPLIIQMSRYGGFEQVGPLGTRLPSDDVQTRTAAGDIVLYSSSQIVVFYGSNSWTYTRLGHIEDQDAASMTALLGSKDETIILSMEKAE